MVTTQQASQQQVSDSGGQRPTVVVAVDGSPSSEAALTWAAQEAGSRGARLRVLYAADVEGADLGGAAVLAHLAREEGARLTAEAAARAVEVEGAPAADLVGTDVRLSRPARALVGASQHADLLVVGNRGRGALAGALLGSVAFAVTAAAACPVVVVRGDAARRPGPEHPVVVGVDGSDAAEVAVAHAARAAAGAGAPLVVLAAWRPPEMVVAGGAYGARYVADRERWAQESAEQNAQAALARARDLEPGVEGEVRVVRERPAQALVAASREAGTVVVGARGHGSVGGLFLGSVSHAVVHGARCPVAVVRPDGEAS